MNVIKKQKMEYLIEMGVEKLKFFGFINVTKENITKDEVYQHYFESMLNKIQQTKLKEDKAITQLLKSMKTSIPKNEPKNWL